MDTPKPEDLAHALVGLHEWAQEFSAEQSSNGLEGRLRTHLGGEVAGLPVASRALEGFQRANFVRAENPATHRRRLATHSLIRGRSGPLTSLGRRT